MQSTLFESTSTSKLERWAVSGEDVRTLVGDIAIAFHIIPALRISAMTHDSDLVPSTFLALPIEPNF